MDWSQMAVVASVLVPLVGVPLALITMYLRSINDFQVQRYAEIEQRLGSLYESHHLVEQMVREYERNYTTKEEWLREAMHARQQLEKLTDLVTRIQVELENGQGLAHQMAQATQAIVQLTQTLVGGLIRSAESTGELETG
ncbi:MAG: hypothetical protein HJJLKODD_02740 [Phycisphaerae bacterium]|nr:hypothetical protein [Phycisphaerae bacterium]